jgi:hypothetical protein
MKSSSRADESQLLTEVPEIGNANVGVAVAGEEGGGADLLFVRYGKIINISINFNILHIVVNFKM